MIVWLAGTAAFLAFGLVLLEMLRIYLPMDVYGVRSLVMFLALLGTPVTRIGRAPSSLARNRHR